MKMSFMYHKGISYWYINQEYLIFTGMSLFSMQPMAAAMCWAGIQRYSLKIQPRLIKCSILSNPIIRQLGLGAVGHSN
jgi:hypothetical protein